MPHDRQACSQATTDYCSEHSLKYTSRSFAVRLKTESVSGFFRYPCCRRSSYLDAAPPALRTGKIQAAAVAEWSVSQGRDILAATLPPESRVQMKELQAGPRSSTPSKFQSKALSAQTPTQIRVAPLHGASRTTKARSVSTHNAARYRHLGFDASHGKTWSTKHGACDPVACRWRPVSHRSSADQAWSPDFLPDFALLGGRFYAEQEQHAVHLFRHEKKGVQHRPTRYHLRSLGELPLNQTFLLSEGTIRAS